MAAPARAAELVLYETASCAWCIKWHRDVGGRYANTKAGHLLPLRRVDMFRPLPADLAAVPRIGSTPTFVIVENGREVGRVVGYSTEGGFWNELAEVVNRWQEEVAKTGAAVRTSS